MGWKSSRVLIRRGVGIAFLVGMLGCVNTDIDGTISSTDGQPMIARDTVEVVVRDTIFIQEDEELSNEFFISPRLPWWTRSHSALKGIIIKDKYIIQSRLNPFYLEEDFNGDGTMDLAVAIKEIEGEKLGFAVLHGGKDECFILGAGVAFENGLSDDLDYVDIWGVNRDKVNEPGLDGEGGGLDTLYLNNPAIRIEKSDLGGGTIYWKGNQYVYFHQSC